MEKRIKILYSLTIVAILGFLGMQVYWLYLRYENSLREYEDSASKKIADLLLDYNIQRENNKDTTAESVTTRSMLNYNMDMQNDSTQKPVIKATVTTQNYFAHKILGINENRKLTVDEQLRAAKMINDNIDLIETKSISYDASSAPDRGAVWDAMDHVVLEMKTPFTTHGIDSVFNKAGIEETAELIVTDSMEWKPKVIRHNSLLNPQLIYSFPYSELEKKSVVLKCRIPVGEIMKEMGVTLIVSIALSMLLILCLVWQFSTIIKLTRLDKMRNMFLTTMIHELKRPISTLMMCVSGIENEKMLADKEIRNELTSNTRTALDNLSAYFSRLRDITFNDVEQIPLNITKFYLGKLIDDVIASLIVPGDKTVTIENKIGEETEISADRTHIFNIFNNLLENSIKYSEDEVKIIVDSLTDENGITIRVRDNGFGISENDRKHIFTRFFRGKTSASEIPGMGLGLTYVKLLTDAHGGVISVESKVGYGTSFSLYFPQ